MEPLIVGIIAFAGVSALIFIIVVIWGIRGLSRKDDVKPVHIHLPQTYPENPLYGGGYYPFEPAEYGQSTQYGYYPENQTSYVDYTDPYQQNYPQYPYSQVVWEESTLPEAEYRPRPPRIVTEKPGYGNRQHGGDHPDNRSVEYPSPHDAADPRERDHPDRQQGLPSSFHEIATEGVQDIIKLVEDYNITTAAGYPAFASSEQKALTQANMSRQDFYNIRNYNYSANDIIPPADILVEDSDESVIHQVSPSVDVAEYEETNDDKEIPILQALPPHDTHGPTLEKRKRAFKHTMEESTKCNICLGFIKTGLPLITCVCSKSYHVSCAIRMACCPICSQDLLDYDDLVKKTLTRDEPVGTGPTLDMEIDAGLENRGGQLNDTASSPDPTMAKLTTNQKEKLRMLLSRYDTNRQYPDLSLTDI